jgi:hypothetical protein
MPLALANLLAVRVPQALFDRLKIRAAKEHTSMQALVVEAIEALLKTPLRREVAQ